MARLNQARNLTIFTRLPESLLESEITKSKDIRCRCKDSTRKPESVWGEYEPAATPAIASRQLSRIGPAERFRAFDDLPYTFQGLDSRKNRFPAGDVRFK